MSHVLCRLFGHKWPNAWTVFSDEVETFYWKGCTRRGCRAWCIKGEEVFHE